MFIENMALAFFLGMCSFLACSKKVETALGLGVAVVFVQVLTVPLNNLILHYLLTEGALAWIIAVAGRRSTSTFLVVHPVHRHDRRRRRRSSRWRVERFAPALYTTLGVFLPLIAVNCVILAGSLFMQERDYTFGESVVYGVGSGWAGRSRSSRWPPSARRCATPTCRHGLRGPRHHVHRRPG